MTELTLYWLTRLDHFHELCDNIISVFAIVIAISIIGLLFCIIEIFVNCDNDDIPKSIVKIRTLLLNIVVVAVIIGCIFNAVKTFVPTTKEMAAIYVIPRIVNNENMQEIGKDTARLANDWLRELRPDIVKDALNLMSSNAVEQAIDKLTKTK